MVGFIGGEHAAFEDDLLQAYVTCEPVEDLDLALRDAQDGCELFGPHDATSTRCGVGIGGLDACPAHEQVRGEAALPAQRLVFGQGCRDDDLEPVRTVGPDGDAAVGACRCEDVDSAVCVFVVAVVLVPPRQERVVAQAVAQDDLPVLVGTNPVGTERSFEW